MNYGQRNYYRKKKPKITLVEFLVVATIVAMLFAILLPVLTIVKDKIGELVTTNAEIAEMPTIFVINDNALWGIGDLGKVQIEPIIPPSKKIKYKIAVKNLPVGAEAKKVGEEYFIIWQPKAQISQEISIITDLSQGKDLVKKIVLEAY